MELFGIYLLKVSALLVIFWGIYLLFLQKETTFKSNRLYLFSGILLAVLLPLLKIKQTIFVDLTTAASNDALTAGEIMLEEPSGFNWMGFLLLVYIAGCLFFAARLLLQLVSIKGLFKNAHIWREQDLKHVETSRQIAPFSFFKSLFYHPKNYSDTELKAILIHEKVHARQWHSLDVLVAEGLKILLWFNPLSWYYQKTIQQNLEFLADAETVDQYNKTSYQYLMVQQATGDSLAITNSFYNSLIKKRIVMLNRNQSKKIQALKAFLVIPMLALFLVGFNTEKVYQFKTSSTTETVESLASVELTISKNTTDAELMRMKKDLAKDAIDFSYTTVRNNAKEIIDISVQISGNGANGGSFKNSHSASDETNGIAPLVIFIDRENNLVSIGSKGSSEGRTARINLDKGKVWISADDEDHQEIIIKEENGKQIVIIDGEEVSEDQLHKNTVRIHMNEDGDHEGYRYKILTDGDAKKQKQVKVKRKQSKKENQVTIIRTDTDEDTVEVVDPEGGFFFIDTDGDPLYVIDGKIASKKDVKKLDPKDIMTIDVRKGDAAEEKYGKKAKNGVVEIITKQ